MNDNFGKISYRQLVQLYNSTRLAIFATLLNTGILAVVLWSTVEQAHIVAWLAAMLCCGILSRHFLQRQRGPLAFSLWARRFAISCFVPGAGWGTAVFLLFPDGHIANQLFLVFIIAGMAAVAATSLPAIFSIATGFLVLMLVPFGVRHTTTSYSNYRCLFVC